MKKKTTRKKSVKNEGKFVVELIESERGWGQKVDSVRRFKKQEKAEAFVKEYNSHNKSAAVPDWYMYARLVPTI
jgi:hypothetical protein